MKPVEIKIQPDASLITVPLGAVRAYAANFFEDKKTVERIVLAVEEALNNVFSYSLADRMEHITVTAEAADGEFTVSVLDRGLPGDYEQTLKGEDRLGLMLMQNIMDEVAVENRGFEGRRQRMVKYYSRIPDLSAENASDDTTVIENAVITVRTPTKNEMLEIGRLFYQEYILTYPNDIVYYPDRFYAAVAKDQIHSTVAVDQFGNVAGHHAAVQWSNVPGIWELGMAVVSSRYRNAGILSKLGQRTDSYIRDEIKARMFLNGCITTHPYSQKTALKKENGAAGFLFNAAPPEIGRSTFKDDNDLTSEAFAVYACDRSERSVYLPDELKAAADLIYDNLHLPCTILTEPQPVETELTEGQWLFNPRLRIGNINYTRHGKDFAGRLKADLYELKSRGSEMVQLFLSMEQPGVDKAYEAAKAEGFFFTAIIPNAEQGDVLHMQKMYSRVIEYEKLVTVEPWTTLLGMIRALDPDQN